MLNLTDTQKSCPHVFFGRADGVHCTRCGLHLTAQQHHELLHPPESEQGAADAAPDKEPTEDEKPTKSAAESQQKKVTMRQAEMRAFIQSTGRTRRYDREQIR